jgi:hypothetical protein
MKKHGGIPQSTLTDWSTQGDRNNEAKYLELPSGNVFRVTEILEEDNKGSLGS